MHCAVGSSLLLLAWRLLNSCAAHGWNGTSSGLMSLAMLPTYPGPGAQSPETSVLPSDSLGAGAERFGLPSAVRGMPAVGYLSHCGAGNPANINVAANIARACIENSPWLYFAQRMVCERPPAGRFAPAAVPLRKGD